MLKTFALCAAAAISLAACSQPKPAQTSFDVSVPFKEVMGHMIDPAAWAFWNRSGDVIDAAGTHSRVPVDPKTITDDPKTYADDLARIAAEDEWTAAESGAIQLIEASNILKLDGYVRKVEKDDNGDWLKFANRLNTLAHEAQAATEAKDGQKMFDTGGAIYEVCTGCHAKYLMPFIDPNTGEIPDGLTAKGEPVQKK